MPETQPRSPPLLALSRRLRTDGRAVLDAFWSEVREQGTPLLEPLRDEGHALLTFLWRGTEAVRNVVVVSPAFSNIPAENRLRRLPNTDIWYRTHLLPADLRLSYRLSANDPLAGATTLTPAQAMGRLSAGETDPLNRHIIPAALVGAPWSLAALPDAPAQPYVAERKEALRGKVHKQTRRSKTLGNERPLWVYTPPAYTTSGAPYGLIVLLDGQAYSSAAAPVPTILDNLIADGAIPPLVAVLVSSVDIETRSRELPCNEPFSDFLVDDVLPWVRQRFHVTSDPANVTLAGVSYGGLAAAFTGLRRPEAFGNVLSQSGSFWWSYEEPEWLTRQVVQKKRVSVRFYMEAGTLEHRGPPIVSLLQANRHLRDVLEAKGYDVHYREGTGGHDFAWWRGTIADGIKHLHGNAAAAGGKAARRAS